MTGTPGGDWLRGKRVLVMGLGTRRGGLGVTRYLAEQGASVTVTDLRPASGLGPVLDELADLPIRFRLGEHRREDFEAAEIVVRNPAVPAGSPWLAIARAAGARIEMEMSLFFRACPAPVTGITGTKGKTTTATICANMLRTARPDTVLAGNMGESALAALPQITPETPVILELSSWQLEGLAEHGLSPHIAVLTNISEDHLNTYPSMADYVEAKRHITRFQGPGDWFIVNHDDPLAWESRHAGSGRIVPFGSEYGVATEWGAWLDGDRLIWRWEGIDREICRTWNLSLPGQAAIMNVLAAAAAALLMGATEAEVRAALATQEPIPHRQEPVAIIAGVLFVNDTAATAPAAALAALDAFRERPVVLIAGGASKRCDLRELARRAANEAVAVVLLDGSATPEFQQLLLAAGVRQLSGPHNAMEPAVRAAAAFAKPGSVVLLAPGCASFGLFRHEFHRGEAFRSAVNLLQSMAPAEGIV